MRRSMIEHYKEILGIGPQHILGPQNYLFSTTSQLSAKFEGQYLRLRTW